MLPAPTDESAPSHDWNLGRARIAVALLLGLTQGLGINMVNANLPQIQGELGATLAEINWLTTAYYASNLSAVVLLAKVRFQFGLRLFADLSILLFLVVSVMDLFTHNLGVAIAIRALLGVAAAPLSTLAVLYMLQAFPQRLAVVGALLGFAVLQLGGPLSRLLSEDVLHVGLWQGMHLLELALALMSVGALHRVKLNSEPPQQMFSLGDIASFGFYAAALALLCVVLTQGRTYWWTDAPWLGVCLATSIACFGIYILVELHRKSPMLDLHWLGSPFMLRFIVAVFLFRIALSETSVGAVGLLTSLGLNNDQMHSLFLWVTAGTLAGFLISLVILAVTKNLRLPGRFGLVLIIIAALLDSRSTLLSRPDNFYLSQTLLALAGSMFLSSALLVGITNVIEGGRKNMVSFIAVFNGAQVLGSLLGGALLSTFFADRVALHYNHLVESITLADPLVVKRLAQLAASVGQNLPDGVQRSAQGLTILAQQVRREALLLAYNDVFELVAIVAMITLAWRGAYAIRMTWVDAWHRNAGESSGGQARSLQSGNETAAV